MRLSDHTAPLPQHAALIRGDDGCLDVRHFSTAADAAAASATSGGVFETGLTAADKRRKMTTSHDLAHELGLHPKTVRRWVLQNEIPAIAHGPRLLMIPNRICQLVKLWGLDGVRRMARRGEL